MSLLEGFGLDLGSLLTPSIRLALPYISHGVAAGLSGDQIQSALSSAGLGVRRQNLLGVIRVMRSQTAATQTIRGSKAASFVPPNLLTPTLGFPRNVYQYKYSVTGLDPLTGETRTQFVIVGSDTPMKLADAEAEALAIIERSADRYKMIPIEANFEAATIDPRFIA